MFSFASVFLMSLSSIVSASIPATPSNDVYVTYNCTGTISGNSYLMYSTQPSPSTVGIDASTCASSHDTGSADVGGGADNLCYSTGAYYTSGGTTSAYCELADGTLTLYLISQLSVSGTSPQVQYNCPDPVFTDLVGTDCFEPASCSNDTAPFISQTPQEQICVTNPDSGTSCNYFTELGQYGNFTGVFANSGQSCECANMPNGSCETLVEPILPEGEDCTIFGTERWCSSDPSQCDGGSLDSCSNCGTVNGTFMCSDGSAPEGDYCYSGTGRSECEGVPDGYCPTGYVCDPLDKEQPDTDDTDEIDQPNCTATDTRPECQGVPDGGQPVKSEETAQLEFTNKQLQALNDNVQQGNKNTAANNLELIEIKNNTAALVDDIQTDEDRSQLDIELAAKKTANLQAMTDSLNSTAERDALSTSSTSLFASLNDSITGSLVPTAVCTDIIIQLPSSSNSVTLPVCTVSTYVRPILAWIFMIVAVIYARRKIFKAVSEVNV